MATLIMKAPRIVPTFIAMALLCAGNLAFATPTISYAGGDGSSMEKAIIIQGADDDEDGVEAEYEYLHAHYPGYKRGDQSVEHSNGHSYDILEFTTADGQTKKVYFDITQFFGR
jgi:hypothetical protein